jgi:hypothetical protein
MTLDRANFLLIRQNEASTLGFVVKLSPDPDTFEKFCDNFFLVQARSLTSAR